MRLIREAFKFLSTPSARRATRQIPLYLPRQGISIHALREEGDPHQAGRPYFRTDFYPRPPRGGRRYFNCNNAPSNSFLSTPSARRATRAVYAAAARSCYFYPRPPRGGRHVDSFRRGGCRGISIHALREEGDSDSSARKRPCENFYPRPPRGGRPSCVSTKYWPLQFLSTPSARRAT